MKNRNKFFISVVSIFLISGVRASANPISANIESSVSISVEDTGDMITSGGVYNLSPLSRGTANNPTTTTGNGRFWVEWPRPDRIHANHSNPSWPHRSTACNSSACVRSNGETGWRAPSRTGHANAWAFASATGNSGHWAINPCNAPGC